MKFKIEVKCTPEEARDFLGLPDLTGPNGVYAETMAKAMKGVTNPGQLKEYAEQLAPMGQVGLKLFQSFVEGGMKGSSEASKKPASKSASGKKKSSDD
jgi:hypothetical protein